ncbi:hypothetical protein HKX48_005923 [Thoreauomyces humboldtii]|nr:hypothetical protein HKX48_005923 [Thoreauomyces humboldtii]
MTTSTLIAPSAPTRSEIQKTAKEFIDGHVAFRDFSGAVILAKGDQVLFSQAGGFADREWNVPNTIDTRFRIGSVTKQFTAALILRLVAQRRITLEATVSTYLTEDQFPAEKGSIITIHHLLAHRSGLYFPSEDIPKVDSFRQTPKETLKLCIEAPLDFAPGTKWAYSNSGYLLLTFLIEVVTGDTFAAVLKREITDPLGMTDTFHDDNRVITQRRARGYDKKAGQWTNAVHVDMSFPTGAGAMISTVTDLHRWTVAISKPGFFEQEYLDLMYNVPKDDMFMTDDRTEYVAYGLMVSVANDRRIIRHGGVINGFLSDLYRCHPTDTTDPSESLIVVVLANNSACGPASITRNLVSIALGIAITLPSAITRLPAVARDLSVVEGSYKFPLYDIRLTFAKDDDGVVMKAEVVMNEKVVQTLLLAPESEDVWYALEQNELKVELTSWVDGKCSELRMGATQVGTRVAEDGPVSAVSAA